MVRPGIRDYFRLRPRTPEGLAAQVDEEIALHIELRVQELVAGGMDPERARAEAERRFGGVMRAQLLLQRSARERERRMSVREWLAGWRQDFAYSARSLAREPLVALVVVLTLGLGIGANATMFGIIDRLLLRGPEHVQAPHEVRRLYITQRSWTGVVETTSSAAYVHYTLVREWRDLFTGAAAYSIRSSRVGRGERARERRVGWVSADFFPLLGVQPALGRFFTVEEDRPREAQRVVVLDYGTWQMEYGGAADVLGRNIELQDERYTVIGVAPAGFTGPQLEAVHMWVPLSTISPPHPEWPTTWNARWVHVLVRRAPEVSWGTANAETTRRYRAAADPAREREAAAVLALRPLAYGAQGAEPAELPVSRWLAGVSLIVLLVACANVTNLLLARALRRRREIAVRLALGVSRGRLARLLLSESLLLACAGGVLAVALAGLGGRALRALLLPDVQWGPALDLRVLVFSAAAVVLTGLLIGLAPVLQSGTRNLSDTLKATSLRAAAGRSTLRSTLTVLQAAFSLVLLVGGALFARSLWNAQQVELGIDASRVLAVWPSYPASGEDSPEAQQAVRSRRDAALRGVLERLRLHPGVARAALAIGTPLQGTLGIDLRVPGRDSLPSLPGGGPFISAVSSGYFETVGTRILRGRGILPSEGKGTAPVVVVGASMATALWPTEDPLGRCLLIGFEDPPCFRVVGIAEDATNQGLRDLPAMRYYVPLGQEVGVGGTHLVVRPRGDVDTFIPELRRLLHELEPDATFFGVNHLQKYIDPQLRPWRLGATMFLAFGGLALLIAAIGLYSVIAYGVAQRRTELGVRIALGASAAAIVGMVLRQGLALVLAGVALGLAIALATGRMLEGLLFEQSARDAGVFAAVTLTLLLVAVLATVVPALRAGKTSPLDALRTE
ncbi:MAG TPA: ADOP family duplicated permease [Longimicrobiales bacterium]|nr:ADOP family duplicated permease [Longimicrobiales bacterium]